MRFLFLILVLILNGVSYAEQPAINGTWDRMDAWEVLKFPSIEKLTSYKIVEDSNGEKFLQAEANASASGLVHKAVIDVYEFPIISWSWKVDNIYKNGDATKKSADDYPIRLYLLFEYDPEAASFFKRGRYASIKLLYGKYPPDTTLSYIWANKLHSEEWLTNTYSDDSIMYLLQKGNERVGNWQQERRHIINDYQHAFEKAPPKKARVAIMSDADNTEESTVAYIKSIKLSN